MFATPTGIICVALGLLQAAWNAYAQPLPPTIVSPKSGDVWTVGQVATAEWSTKGFQIYENDRVTPVYGIPWLGRLVNTTEDGYQLWGQEPLAQMFPLPLTKIQVVVPDVPSGSNYLLSLGQNDNLGELFTIRNPADPNSTGVAPSSISVSTLSFPTSVPPEFATTPSSSTASATIPSSAISSSNGSGTSSAPPANMNGEEAARLAGAGMVQVVVAFMTVAFLATCW